METVIRGKTITYQVQFSNRQKPELEISPEGLVLVKAPANAKPLEIMEFLKKNAKRLIQNQERLENRVFVSSRKEYTEDENFMYLGRACKLENILTNMPDTPEEVQKELKKFYTKQTKKIIAKRVAYYEEVIKVKAKSFAIVESVSTWGTCNSNRELTFNYKLSMALPEAIDYVVIHELCHLLHLNHDRSFWRDVGKYDKKYKEHEAYLSHFGGVMTI